MSHPKVPADLRCDFCGSLESHGREMVAGPGIYICDRCVDLSVEVLEERGGLESNKAKGPAIPVADNTAADRLTPRAERVLLASGKEASQLGHDYIGTEHLLLGLLDEPDGVACRVLLELGVDKAARTRVLEIVRSAPYAQPSSEPPE